MSIAATMHLGLYTAYALLKLIEEMQLELKCFPQFDLLEIVGEQGSRKLVHFTWERGSV